MRSTFFKNGMKAAYIGEKLGVHRSVISMWCKKYGVSPYEPDPVAAMTRISNAIVSIRLSGRRPKRELVMRKLAINKVETKAINSPAAEYVAAYRLVDCVLKSIPLQGVISEETRLDLKDAQDYLKEKIFTHAITVG